MFCFEEMLWETDAPMRGCSKYVVYIDTPAGGAKNVYDFGE